MGNATAPLREVPDGLNDHDLEGFVLFVCGAGDEDWQADAGMMGMRRCPACGDFDPHEVEAVQTPAGPVWVCWSRWDTSTGELMEYDDDWVNPDRDVCDDDGGCLVFMDPLELYEGEKRDHGGLADELAFGEVIW